MERKGCIYREPHNHGRRSGGSQDGNRSSLRRVRGAGAQLVYGYRWVAEISIHGKLHRHRSYDYSNVVSWLEEMREKYRSLPYYSTEEKRQQAVEAGKQLANKYGWNKTSQASTSPQRP